MNIYNHKNSQNGFENIFAQYIARQVWTIRHAQVMQLAGLVVIFIRNANPLSHSSFQSLIVKNTIYMYKALGYLYNIPFCHSTLTSRLFSAGKSTAREGWSLTIYIKAELTKRVGWTETMVLSASDSREWALPDKLKTPADTAKHYYETIRITKAPKPLELRRYFRSTYDFSSPMRYKTVVFLEPRLAPVR